jgi:hypothetical protein
MAMFDSEIDANDELAKLEALSQSRIGPNVALKLVSLLRQAVAPHLGMGINIADEVATVVESLFEDGEKQQRLSIFLMRRF